MGMFREPGSEEIDIVKEMAESLGSQGNKVEDFIGKANSILGEIDQLLENCRNYPEERRPSVDLVNNKIREFNSFVDKAEDALRWLLIQREACGFRTHKNVSTLYPIPTKKKLIKTCAA
jgi:hypothetical protein